MLAKVLGLTLPFIFNAFASYLYSSNHLQEAWFNVTRSCNVLEVQSYYCDQYSSNTLSWMPSGQQAAPPVLFDLAHVLQNGDLKALMSMEQHHKLPMNGDFPLRDSNETQEELLQFHSPHLHCKHLKAVHREIS